mmetsp:Transcript_2354/g.5349  ORF Transcript_2354/g.5349 Transcript_2354/m.5349 type:complete len:300 (-) Transcript_2354:6390-7289(-)
MKLLSDRLTSSTLLLPCGTAPGWDRGLCEPGWPVTASVVGPVLGTGLPFNPLVTGPASNTERDCACMVAWGAERELTPTMEVKLPLLPRTLSPCAGEGDCPARSPEELLRLCVDAGPIPCPALKLPSKDALIPLPDMPMAPTPAPLALKPFMGDALPAARAPLKRTPPPTAMAGGAVGGGEGCRLLLLLARGMVGRSCWERERVRAGEGLTALMPRLSKDALVTGCVEEKRPRLSKDARITGCVEVRRPRPSRELCAGACVELGRIPPIPRLPAVNSPPSPKACKREADLGPPPLCCCW